MDSVVYGSADGSEVDRGRGLEVVLYAEGTEPLCTQQLPFYSSSLPIMHIPQS